MVVFLRPKDTNRTSGDNTKLVAEATGVVQSYENEYILKDGTFDSTADGKSGSMHHKDAVRREAPPSSPLPSGNKPSGYSGTGGKSWSTPATAVVSSGFGKGTRAGKSGRRR